MVVVVKRDGTEVHCSTIMVIHGAYKSSSLFCTGICFFFSVVVTVPRVVGGVKEEDSDGVNRLVFFFSFV